jgi:hypothetical protein
VGRLEAPSSPPTKAPRARIWLAIGRAVTKTRVRRASRMGVVGVELGEGEASFGGCVWPPFYRGGCANHPQHLIQWGG